MGKSQSKLSADELAELQKNTYCELSTAFYASGHLADYQSTRRNCNNGCGISEAR